MMTAIHTAVTSNDVEMNTIEMKTSTDTLTSTEMTTHNIKLSMDAFIVDAGMILDNTTLTMKTSTVSTKTSNFIIIPETDMAPLKTETSDGPIAITEKSSTLRVPTSASTAEASVLTTTNETDVVAEETTTRKISSNGPPVAGIVAGTLAVVFVIVSSICVYVNRRKLSIVFSRKSRPGEVIIPVYSTSDSPDGYIRLNHMRQQSPST